MASKKPSHRQINTPESILPDLPRIVLAQHRTLDCLALSALLLSSPEIDIVGTSISLHSLTMQCRKLRPDIAIVDTRYPGGEAFDEAEMLIQKSFVRQVLFLDDEHCASHAEQALAIPNADYFTKEDCFEDLHRAIKNLTRRALNLGVSITSRRCRNKNGQESKRQFSSPEMNTLSAREIEVLELLAEGNSVRVAAAKLAIAESTVDNHKTRLKKKLGIHKVTELTRIAMREGLIE